MLLNCPLLVFNQCPTSHRIIHAVKQYIHIQNWVCKAWGRFFQQQPNQVDEISMQYPKINQISHVFPYQAEIEMLLDFAELITDTAFWRARNLASAGLAHLLH